MAIEKRCLLALCLALAGAWAVTAGDWVWVLRPPPYTIEDLGPLVQANTLSDKFMFRTAAGATHLVLGYYYGNVSTNRCELLDVNLETGEARKIVATYGRPFRMALLQNDKAYLMTSDPGWLMEWDPVTGATRDIAPTADKTTQSHAIGTGGDGQLHIGGAVKGYLEVYNPVTDVKTNYGIMDDPGPPYYRYVYTLGADARYDYCGMGQNPWYLVILDRQTGQQTVYWKNLGNTGLTVSQATNDEWYVSRSGTDGSCWYHLTGGVPVEVPANQVPPLKPWYMRGNVCHDIAGFASYGYEVDLDDAYPDSSNNATATVRWRRIGETEWRTASVSGFGIAPMTLKRIYAPPGRETLHGWAYPYGPNFNYDPATNAATIIGNNQRSMYHCLFYDHRWYMAGYAAILEEYDSTKPWTLKVSSNISDPTINPHQVPIGLSAKYYYYAAKGADGCVYVGGHRERDATGGALGWYHPDTGARGNVPYEVLYQYDTRDLIAVNNGAQIVYSSVAINGATEAKLFVLDVATKSIIGEYTPIPGGAETGKLAEVAPGVICGVTASTIYRLNLNSGVLEYRVAVPGTAFYGIPSYDRRLEKGPDGFLWLFVGTPPRLCRINPADGSVQEVLSHNTMRSVCFSDGDAYLYIDANPQRIRNLLIRRERFRLALKTGWNLVSIPLAPDQPAHTSVFPPEQVSAVWEYDSQGSYAVPDVIQPKKGYWVRANEDTTIEVIGLRPEDVRVPVSVGWNLIGVVGTETQPWQPMPPPETTAAVWGYQPPYSVPREKLLEGEGFWVYAVDDATLF